MTLSSAVSGGSSLSGMRAAWHPAEPAPTTTTDGRDRASGIMSDLQTRTGHLRASLAVERARSNPAGAPGVPEEAAVGPGDDAGRSARRARHGLPRRPRRPAPARAAPRAGLAEGRRRASITRWRFDVL